MTEDRLTVPERAELKDHETTIATGMATFLDVGRALLAIREGKLYRVEHKTFEEYCLKKWHFTKTHAYRLIDAVDVAAEVKKSPIGDKVACNEATYRELASVPEGEVSAILEAAAARAGDAPITARVIRETRQEQAAEPEDEPGSTEPDIDDAQGICKGVTTAINEALRLLKNAPQQYGTEMLVARRNSIRNELEDAKGAIVVVTPHAECPRCKGKGCAQCGNHGWVNRKLYAELTG